MSKAQLIWSTIALIPSILYADTAKTWYRPYSVCLTYGLVDVYVVI